MALLCTACRNNKKGSESTDKGTTMTTTNTTNPTGMVWPDSTKTAFIEGCVNNSKGKMPEDQARKVCTCMQEKIEAKYPNYLTTASRPD